VLKGKELSTERFPIRFRCGGDVIVDPRLGAGKPFRLESVAGGGHSFGMGTSRIRRNHYSTPGSWGRPPIRLQGRDVAPVDTFAGVTNSDEVQHQISLPTPPAVLDSPAYFRTTAHFPRPSVQRRDRRFSADSLFAIPKQVWPTTTLRRQKSAFARRLANQSPDEAK
jgi:hypothetical protein